MHIHHYHHHWLHSPVWDLASSPCTYYIHTRACQLLRIYYALTEVVTVHFVGCLTVGLHVQSDYVVGVAVERRRAWVQPPLCHDAVPPSQPSLHLHNRHPRVDWVVMMQYAIATSVHIATPEVQAALPAVASTVHGAHQNRWQLPVTQQSIRWSQERKWVNC